MESNAEREAFESAFSNLAKLMVGQVIAVVAPNHRRAFHLMRGWFNELKPEHVTMRAAHHCLEHRGGGRMVFLASNDPGALRGWYVKGAIVYDEAGGQDMLDLLGHQAFGHQLFVVKLSRPSEHVLEGTL